MRLGPELAYVIWVLVSTVAALQALAAYYQWDGLSFFRGRRRLAYLCSAVSIAASYVWFFSLTNRNVPGLEGWQLFSRFIVAAAAGVAVVLVVSSLLNSSMPSAPLDDRRSDVGLDHLRREPYGRIIMRALNKANNGER